MRIASLLAFVTVAFSLLGLGCDGFDPIPRRGLLLGQLVPSTTGLRAFPKGASEIYWLSRLQKALLFEELEEAAGVAAAITERSEGEELEEDSAARLWTSGRDRVSVARVDCAEPSPRRSLGAGAGATCWSVEVNLADGSWFREDFASTDQGAFGQVVFRTSSSEIVVAEYRSAAACQSFVFLDPNGGPRKQYGRSGDFEFVRGFFPGLRLEDGQSPRRAWIAARWDDGNSSGGGKLEFADPDSFIAQCWLGAPLAAWTSTSTESLDSRPEPCLPYLTDDVHEVVCE